MRHLMSPLDFSVEELDQLMDLANDIEKNPEKYAHACDGKRLATLFYEPSTRTRLSFEAAMMNLGGTVLGFSSANSSSASKGESVADTIRVVSCFANICAMRHPKEGAPLVASMYSRIPVINAGDGGHQHPTQTLTDLLTIRSLKGRLNNLTIGFCGDLKFGRTVHSLIEALVQDSMADENNTGIQVYIGNETPVQTMKDCSVVTATYELEEGVKGTIGIIGPRRMDYDKVISTLTTLKSQLDTIYKKDDDKET